ncbi:hypothetical protein R1flu_006915 [Riccia fluitans]|uniref:Secreted protein n=1 Tax=Riccia fluitans TaxID=41844 RepID=A0ABD1YXY9_9MARC
MWPAIRPHCTAALVRSVLFVIPATTARLSAVLRKGQSSGFPYDRLGGRWRLPSRNCNSRSLELQFTQVNVLQAFHKET